MATAKRGTGVSEATGRCRPYRDEQSGSGRRNATWNLRSCRFDSRKTTASLDFSFGTRKFRSFTEFILGRGGEGSRSRNTLGFRPWTLHRFRSPTDFAGLQKNFEVFIMKRRKSLKIFVKRQKFTFYKKILTSGVSGRSTDPLRRGDPWTFHWLHLFKKILEGKRILFPENSTPRLETKSKTRIDRSN